MKGTALALALAVLAAALAPAQQIREIEFRNQPITDILIALAEMAGRSIVPDETVSGNASYYFTSMDFETALGVFLSTYKLRFWREGSITYVSRVFAQHNKATGTVTVDADDVDLRLIVRALSRAIGKTILFDTLPKEPLTIHATDAAPAAVLDILMRRFPDFTVEADKDFFYVRKTDAATRPAAGASVGTGSLVRVDRGQYSIDVDRARFRDILVELFRKAGLEYSLFLRTDVILENLHFSGKSRDEMLRLVMEQANADYTVENGIYYVYDIQRTDVLKKLKTVRQIPLSHVAVQDLPGLFPQELASQNLYRLDKAANTVILTGSEEEIGPIEEFIRAIDRPTDGKTWHLFTLSFLKVSDLAGILPPSFGGLKPIVLPQSNSFVMLLSMESRNQLAEYLPLVDRRQAVHPIQLKYIQADSLLKNLPPSVSKEDLVATGDSTLLFFTGSEEKRRLLLRELELLDRPVPQIRYELLVVKYHDQEGLNWTRNLDVSATPASLPTAFLGSIAELLKLNFNIVSTFGSLFALELSLGLKTKQADVLADTSLTGLSGQEIRFQNTDTTRYREPATDPDTGKLLPTGVTHEISTGLIIGMSGWVSGDGMITMKVASTVSKEAVASSTSEPEDLPATSESIVSTNVRTPSGTPVVIGGLIQQSRELTIDKTPFLGDIPLLGLLFQNRIETTTTTELVIYIVPHLEYPAARRADAARRMEDLYTLFVKGP
jgi:type II secretory pathway component GspD/PulD (secretin)